MLAQRAGHVNRHQAHGETRSKAESRARRLVQYVCALASRTLHCELANCASIGGSHLGDGDGGTHNIFCSTISARRNRLRTFSNLAMQCQAVASRVDNRTSRPSRAAAGRALPNVVPFTRRDSIRTCLETFLSPSPHRGRGIEGEGVENLAEVLRHPLLSFAKRSDTDGFRTIRYV